MTVDLCARLLDVSPRRSSRKIIAFRSGCGWVLPVVLLALAALPAFGQRNDYREIELCTRGLHSHAYYNIPGPGVLPGGFSQTGGAATYSTAGGTNVIEINASSVGSSTISFNYDQRNPDTGKIENVVVTIHVTVKKCPEPTNAAPPPPGGGGKDGGGSGGGGVGKAVEDWIKEHGCPTQADCDKYQADYEAAQAAYTAAMAKGDGAAASDAMAKASEAVSDHGKCLRALKACPPPTAQQPPPPPPPPPGGGGGKGGGPGGGGGGGTNNPPCPTKEECDQKYWQYRNLYDQWLELQAQADRLNSLAALHSALSEERQQQANAAQKPEDQEFFQGQADDYGEQAATEAANAFSAQQAADALDIAVQAAWNAWLDCIDKWKKCHPGETYNTPPTPYLSKSAVIAGTGSGDLESLFNLNSISAGNSLPPLNDIQSIVPGGSSTTPGDTAGGGTGGSGANNPAGSTSGSNVGDRGTGGAGADLSSVDLQAVQTALDLLSYFNVYGYFSSAAVRDVYSFVQDRIAAGLQLDSDYLSLLEDVRLKLESGTQPSTDTGDGGTGGAGADFSSIDLLAVQTALDLLSYFNVYGYFSPAAVSEVNNFVQSKIKAGLELDSDYLFLLEDVRLKLEPGTQSSADTGGSAGVAALTSGEVYNETTDTMTAVTKAMSDAHVGAGAALMDDGTVVIVGGMGSSATAGADVFTPPGFTIRSPLTDPLRTLIQRPLGDQVRLAYDSGALGGGSGPSWSDINRNFMALSANITADSAVLDAQIAVNVAPNGAATIQVINDTVTLDNFNWNLNPIPSFLTGLATSLVVPSPSLQPVPYVRYAHTVTALSTGQLVVIGGYDSTGAALASIEQVIPTISTGPSASSGLSSLLGSLLGGTSGTGSGFGSILSSLLGGMISGTPAGGTAGDGSLPSLMGSLTSGTNGGSGFGSILSSLLGGMTGSPAGGTAGYSGLGSILPSLLGGPYLGFGSTNSGGAGTNAASTGGTTPVKIAVTGSSTADVFSPATGSGATADTTATTSTSAALIPPAMLADRTIGDAPEDHWKMLGFSPAILGEAAVNVAIAALTGVVSLPPGVEATQGQVVVQIRLNQGETTTGPPIQIQLPATNAQGTGGQAELLGPDDLELRLDQEGRVVLARGPWELASLNDAPPLGLESGTASWMAAPLPSALPPQVIYWLEANGNSAGEAFVLWVLDPGGQFKKVVLPEGVVLEPAAPPPQKPVKRAGNELMDKINAVCLEEAKLPPARGMIYKIADAAAQQQYRAARYALKALRKRAAAGQIQPDSNPEQYAIFLQQYVVWAILGGWNQQQFLEHWIEHTKKTAQARNIAWTQQMDDTLRAASAKRWDNIVGVRQEAESMMRSESQGQ